MTREFIAKWADEILDIAKENWGNLVLLKKLHVELEQRPSNAGIIARNQVSARIGELEAQEQNPFERVSVRFLQISSTWR